MNIYLGICHIKNELRHKIVSLEYFMKCFSILDNLLKMEDNQGALSFANVLKEATVEINTQEERREYYKYYNNILQIISKLEEKLQVKNIKIR